jgi:hypothetical protein
VPAGVRVMPVDGGPQEERRVLLAWLPHPLPEAAARLADALRATVAEADAPA